MLKIRARHWKPSKFKELGRGGEAVVYKMRKDIVAKVFLLPNAPEFADHAELQKAARARIRDMQTKLFEFPRDLPEQLIAPTGVLVDEKDRVFGYVMPFVDGIPLDKLGRTSSVLTERLTGKLLMSLHNLVSALHARGVVIGDFNENNIIVTRGKPHLIDADSMQFGPYQCRSFIPRFTAPELLKLEKSKVGAKRNGEVVTPLFSMVAPHSELTDWYSFLVIAMRLLTFTDPYGGVIKGMDLAERLGKRVTVFDRRVVYPRVARPIRNVHRPILEVFFRVFCRGERFVPDRELFEILRTPPNQTTNRKEEYGKKPDIAIPRTTGPTPRSNPGRTNRRPRSVS